MSHEHYQNIKREVNTMGELSYTTAQVQERLDAIPGLSESIGTLAELETTSKDNLVSAVNELFTYAGEAKSGAVAVLTAHGADVSETDDWDTLLDAMDAQFDAWRLITNDDAITPTGTYANATYYNVNFGIKISYSPDGDVIVTVKGGTSTAYENIIFTLTTSISGVTLSQGAETTWNASVSPEGHVYSCVISGLTKKASMAVKFSAINATNDTTTCAITLTAV